MGEFPFPDELEIVTKMWLCSSITTDQVLPDSDEAAIDDRE